MFVVTVKFVVSDDRVEDFMPLMQDNAATSLADEPGCHRFDVCQHPERPAEIFLYELYDDAAAFEVHKTLPHFVTFSELVEPMVESKSVETFMLVGGK